MKMQMIICIILAIIIIGILSYAVMNEGKLWEKKENYKCSKHSDCCSAAQLADKNNKCACVLGSCV